MEMETEYKCIYAKAWLLRGTLRAELNNLGSSKWEYEIDFKTSQKLDPYDANLYVAWARTYWRAGDFETADARYTMGIKRLETEFAAKLRDGVQSEAVQKRDPGNITQAVGYLKEEKRLMNMQLEAKKNAPAPSGCCLQ